MLIAVVSQKGGVGKSSISRTLAVEFTRAGWSTLLADVDSSQITSNRWAEKRRNSKNIKPEIKTEVFSMSALAIEKSNQYDLTIIDGAPHATAGTLDASKAADLVIIPTGTSMDDLEPSILLANELANSLNSEKIVFALFKTTSDAQIRESKETLNQFGYCVFDSVIAMKTGYIDAFDNGYCLTETKYKNLNERAKSLVQEVANKLKAKNNG
jgi:chromosome partitioning protein